MSGGYDQYDRWSEGMEHEPRGSRGNPTAGKAKLLPPAIVMMIIAVIGLVNSGMLILSSQNLEHQLAEFDRGVDADPNAPLEQRQKVKDFARDLATVYEKSIPFLMAAGIIGNLLVIVGAINMLKASSRGMSVFASILVMLPGVSCICIGIPIGIWSLIVLNHPDTRAAFLKSSTGSSPNNLYDDNIH